MPLNIRDLAISSAEIAHLSAIDPRFAADTGNKVPALAVAGVPEGTRELALIVHDPDAPLPNGFTHWTAYGIPADAATIDATTGRTGPNGAGELAYSGPQPPHGHGRHHYYFLVYALDREVDGTPTREEFLANYADNIIEQNRFVGYYER